MRWSLGSRLIQALELVLQIKLVVLAHKTPENGAGYSVVVARSGALTTVQFR